MAHRFGQFVLLAAVCFEPGLRAQDGASLRLVEERLQDAHRLAEHHAFVFVGGISRMESVSLPRCRTTVEEKLEYSISTLLWNDPESYAENGSKVAKGFTDCTQRWLPAPFFEGTKLIVYCEAEPIHGDRCLPPTKYTDITTQERCIVDRRVAAESGRSGAAADSRTSPRLARVITQPSDSFPWRGLRLESG